MIWSVRLDAIGQVNELAALGNSYGAVGFSRVVWAWAACAANCLAIKPFGELLAALFWRFGRPLGLKTVFMIASLCLGCCS
jgi:hypothetical protein